MERRLFVVIGTAAFLATAALKAQETAPPTLAVTMTNDAAANKVLVYNASSKALLQTVPTTGKGGVTGNARGISQYADFLVAAVNYGSKNVSVFRVVNGMLIFDKAIATTSAPVSVDFGNRHLYVAGETTVDSFPIHGFGGVSSTMDGSVALALAAGGVPPAGSTAQVGVLDASSLLVTLKTDPTPGTVDIIALQKNGAVASTPPKAVAAPTGSLTPFGFSVYPDGTALITLAHSGQDGLFRAGAFKKTITSGGQTGPCWTTSIGKYVMIANTGSMTVSRVIGTGDNIFVDDPAAATIASGGAPSDIDANSGILGVIDHTSSTSHLSLFTYNEFGELTASGTAIDLGVAGANGIAIIGRHGPFHFPVPPPFSGPFPPPFGAPGHGDVEIRP